MRDTVTDESAEHGGSPRAEGPERSPRIGATPFARDVLARTVQFLASCASDPEAAFKAQDPQALIRELEALMSAGPAREERAEADLPSIPVRRRRSA
jgi:hypothetical protein